MIKTKKVFTAALVSLLLASLTAGCSLKSKSRESIPSENSAFKAASGLEQRLDKQVSTLSASAPIIKKEAEVQKASPKVEKTAPKPTIKKAAPVKVASKNTTAKKTSSKPAASKPKSSTTNASKPAASGAQALDWWTEAQYVFPRGASAKVTDLYTGKTFNIKRTYGTNHADCEALTLSDSKVIKSIWGGWSWVRRPVILQVNGKRIAASMAAMPHAGLDKYPANQTVDNRSGDYGTGTNLDAVKGNGMDGVFDVHFLNSRTHGSNKVDSQHQTAIKQAINK